MGGRDGRFVVEGLPGEPLTLRVSVSDPEAGSGRQLQAELRLDPRSGSDVGRIRLEVDRRDELEATMNALRFITVPANSELGRAGVRDGDILVGIGGKEFSGLDEMAELFEAAADDSRIKLDLQRGDERIQLEVPQKAPRGSAGRQGVIMEPTRRP